MNESQNSILTLSDKELIIKEAVALKSSGKYNCAQAVACAFAPIIGADKNHIYTISHAFGNGMGCLEATCGSLTGAGMIVGLASGDRVKAMRTMAGILKKFQDRNGATVCKMLKGISTNPETGEKVIGKPLRACNLCVADTSEFLAEALAPEI
mgnify:FL=1